MPPKAHKQLIRGIDRSRPDGLDIEGYPNVSGLVEVFSCSQSEDADPQISRRTTTQSRGHLGFFCIGTLFALLVSLAEILPRSTSCVHMMTVKDLFQMVDDPLGNAGLVQLWGAQRCVALPNLSNLQLLTFHDRAPDPNVLNFHRIHS